MGKKFSAIRIP